jgi:hypothetical protein
LNPTLIGCVDYTFVYEAVHHQTGFLYDVTGPKWAIWPEDGDIPADKLTLRRQLLGSYAD